MEEEIIPHLRAVLASRIKQIHNGYGECLGYSFVVHEVQAEDLMRINDMRHNGITVSVRKIENVCNIFCCVAKSEQEAKNVLQYLIDNPNTIPDLPGHEVGNAAAGQMQGGYNI